MRASVQFSALNQTPPGFPTTSLGRCVKQRSLMPSRSTASPLTLPKPQVLAQFAQTLLAFYEHNARSLPWRERPTAYAVWVSEMMLQQTQVTTVLPYFARWMQRFPSIEALANADQSDVLSAWQGLGYYARARALHAGAQHVLELCDGKLPQRAAELQRLPGIGPYTAGAISSIAFEQPAPIVDGNVIRVLCRVFGLPGSPTHQPLKSFLWQLAEAVIPHNHARDFNQALMEFGALCCTPKAPLCVQCPAKSQCYAYKHNAVDRFPELRARPKVTHLVTVAALVRRKASVLVAQLPPNAPRWANMWQFPNVELAPSERTDDAARRALMDWCAIDGAIKTARSSDTATLEEPAAFAEVKHSVTRYRITLKLIELTTQEKPQAKTCQAVLWADAEQLRALPMPAAHRRLATLACDT
jgi:A/G-specific adenine glycosylase